jgi:hypothetical protein
MSTRTESTARKSSKGGRVALGRSAATGRLVFAPVSKGGSVIVEQVRAAIESVRNSKK